MKLSFPLIHGSSTHYFDHFVPGSTPTAWAHCNSAIQFLRQTTNAIASLGGKVEFWERDALAQASHLANWQHGQIFLTPSRESALRYARSGAKHGGELLTMCASALERLLGLDPESYRRLKGNADDLARYLDGGGQPMLVVFDGVETDDLYAERSGFESVDKVLSRLPQPDDPHFDVITQQSNFRFRENKGIVSRLVLIEESSIS